MYLKVYCRSVESTWELAGDRCHWALFNGLRDAKEMDSLRIYDTEERDQGRLL